MNYGLYNKEIDKILTHPRYGVWSTSSLEQATDMLLAAQKYIKELNMSPDNIAIIDLDTDKLL